MRLYVVALVAFVVELVSVLFVLKQGPFAARINGVVLLIALPLSFYGATNWGLTGAAAGSVAAIYAERLLSLARISRLTATPISRLQDWHVLGCILGAGALAALIAGVTLHWAPWSSFARLVAGAALVAATYPVALYVFGQGGQLIAFFSSLRNRAPA
jgi:hypothetical protein